MIFAESEKHLDLLFPSERFLQDLKNIGAVRSGFRTSG